MSLSPSLPDPPSFPSCLGFFIDSGSGGTEGKQNTPFLPFLMLTTIPHCLLSWGWRKHHVPNSPHAGNPPLMQGAEGLWFSSHLFNICVDVINSRFTSHLDPQKGPIESQPFACLFTDTSAQPHILPFVHLLPTHSSHLGPKPNHAVLLYKDVVEWKFKTQAYHVTWRVFKPTLC